MEHLAPHDRLAALGLSLPPAPKPAGVYKPCLIDGHHVYVSGHGPLQSDGTLIIGRVRIARPMALQAASGLCRDLAGGSGQRLWMSIAGSSFGDV